eukprot:gene28785-33922_t
MFLSRTVDVIAAEFSAYMRTPSQIVQTFVEFLGAVHPNDVADPAWIRSVVQPLIRASLQT